MSNSTSTTPDSTTIVEIRDLAHGGEGVGKAADGDDARVWFVEGALPGERVRVGLTGEHKRWLRGHVVELLERSALRVEPPCPVADRCGGCTWQHVDPAAQAQLKADIVANQLRRIDLPTPVAVPSPLALGYRRRARLHYRVEGRTLELGFFGQRSHQLVDADHCPVLDPALDWAMQQLRGWASWLPATGSVHGLSNGVEVVLGLPGVRPHPELEVAIRELIASSSASEAGPTLVGVQLRGGREHVGVGRTSLELDGDGPIPPVTQGPFTFSQAQARQNAALVEHVVAMAQPAERRVLELHAGVGNFSRALARSAKRVWTIDGDREAVANLQRTAERWGLPINVKRGQAEKLLGKLAAGGRTYEVVVCDPPRAGIGVQAAKDLIAVASDRIVYVSCDPATLARDLAAMVGPGSPFEVVDLRVFDMMPMTAEVEVVVTLKRRGRGSGAA
ncbi:class I SAM-dependent RNA methyltransferase [Enhygromyxa salina]|uniref:23S rRNA (Uracil-C(5))-methyltransferase RlmCD n=1 Tax=Enhygromyxa salina TaxID=215803 RepID=A0A2S9YPL3_9BACT|nr:class I SAM-dependent RNA methyltransferase [Enhygromyxa salina]PRQ07035.1 23S rRNA (uracil-C(5))-methyltransferase RlmCD [Enhygromyxa salina]